ncbi:alpha/beta hydrolase [SAR202 cluster bacterium AC-647-N09_OGT_505m]|nr:alpha/beta hydrolase [SAR202 cluster bacterium AC-647-N09_OGT_505m]
MILYCSVEAVTSAEGRGPFSKHTTGTAISLRYLEWEGDGSPVILLHGLTVCAEYWSLTAQILAQTHRVVSVDLRGHGHSDKPDWGYDYQTVAGDIEQLCKEIGIEAALLAGHSWGAGVALCLAASNPSIASRLALVDGGFGGPRRTPDGTPPDYEQMMAPLDIYQSRQTYLQAAGAGIMDVMSPEIEEILMASVTVNPDGTISERLSRENNVRILQAMGALNAVELYPALQMPVLFAAALSSSPDRLKWNDRKRESVRRARELVSDGREQWFPDTAHDIQIHRPKELTQVLEDLLH